MEIQHPRLLEFAALADARLSEDEHQGFFHLRDALADLAFRSDLLSCLSAEALKRIAADRHYVSQGWEPHNILLAGAARWQLRVGVYTRTPQFIYSLPYHLLICVLGSESLHVERFRLPTSREGATLDNGVSEEILPGSTVSFDARSEGSLLRIRAPVVAIKFNSRAHDTLQWAFCPKTRRALRPIATDAVDSDLVAISRAARAMERPSSLESTLLLCAHPSHFVRWSALQALARLAPRLAMEHLRAALDDSHPHVADAARRALDAINANKGLPHGH